MDLIVFLFTDDLSYSWSSAVACGGKWSALRGLTKPASRFPSDQLPKSIPPSESVIRLLLTFGRQTAAEAKVKVNRSSVRPMIGCMLTAAVTETWNTWNRKVNVLLWKRRATLEKNEVVRRLNTSENTNLYRCSERPHMRAQRRGRRNNGSNLEVMLNTLRQSLLEGNHSVALGRSH